MVDEVPTPTGDACAYCGRAFVDGDRGIVTPYAGVDGDPRTSIGWHLTCLLAAVGVRDATIAIDPP